MVEGKKEKYDSIKSVCCYCASSSQINENYFNEAIKLSNSFADNDISLVYGGGNSGLMGQLANTLLSRNGKVIGVIPKFMYDNKWGHDNATEMIVTKDMHERKKKMADLSDAVVALPGGVGTLEELIEMITWKKLALYKKPIVILNVDGYYDDLIKMFEKAVKENFMSEQHGKMFKVVEKAEDVLDAIVESEEWTDDHLIYLEEKLYVPGKKEESK